jgi:prepilin-type N-terminal cleavage/methylation domain-containing protein
MRFAVAHKARHGFTLIEVLVTVVIIGIAGALIVPHLLRAGTLGVQAAVRMTIADIVVAQNEAVAQQATRRVVFDQADNLYSLTDGNGNVIGATWMPNYAEGAGNYVINIGNDSRFEGVTLENPNFGGQAYLEFDALGSPVEGGSVDLVYGSFRYRIAVAPFTGRISITAVAAGP